MQNARSTCRRCEGALPCGFNPEVCLRHLCPHFTPWSNARKQPNRLEVHSETWLKQQLLYLQDCKRHHDRLLSFSHVSGPMSLPLLPHTKVIGFDNVFQLNTLFICRWFLAAHIPELWCRLPAILAATASIYGSILKIDSTKKIRKKLQGAAANTASWATNVGNERGEILISVLTESEGIEGLQPMALGLIQRHEHAAVEHPLVLYTDRDCCARSGPSQYQVSLIIKSINCLSYLPLIGPLF